MSRGDMLPSVRDPRLSILLSVLLIVGSSALVIETVPGASTTLERGLHGLQALLPSMVDAAGVVKDLGPYQTQQLMVGVSLGLPDPQAADAYVYAMDSPSSPYFGRTLTPQEWSHLFAPTPAEYAAVEQYYSGLGLHPLTTSDRLMLGLVGTSSRVASAFHTDLHRYSMADGREVFGPSAPVLVPARLDIDAVTGFTNLTGPTPEKVSSSFLTQGLTTVGPSPTLTHGNWTCTNGTQACDEPGYYNEYPLFRKGYTGTGITVGIVDAYDSAETQSMLSTSLTQWASGGGLPAPHENFLYPIPTTYNLNNSASSGWGGETNLDQSMVDMTAPGATIDVTFASDQSFAVYEAVDYLVAHNVSQVISMSWGEPDVGMMQVPPQNPCLAYYSCNASWDGSYAFLHPVFAEAAAIGITPFAAAGDCGAADGTAGFSTDYPASDPFVVGVGGTIPNGTGQVYQGETGWNGTGTNCTGNFGGGGGGYAPWAQPWWQQGPGQLTKGLRGVPDVSADASSGTSQAAPMWAGWTAVADQIHGGGLGLLGPSLYRILRNTTAYHQDFHDITIGNNGYSAGPYWDPVTGLGSPNASQLLPALAAYRPPADSTLRVSLAATLIPGGTGMNVSLVARATGGRPPYSFDFIPGLYLGQWTGSRSTLNYTYPSKGVYTAMVTVFDNASNSSTSLPVVVNLGGKNLTATLSESVSLVGVNSPVTFQSTATGGTNPYQFTYYYGDNTYGFNGTTKNVHEYGAPGIFCPEVVVTDAANPEDIGVATGTCITVSPGVPPPVTISAFNATPSSIKVGSATRFTVSASGGTAPYAYSYAGLPTGCVTANTSQLNCTPTVAGNFTVNVTVTDTHHASATASTALTVQALPNPLRILSFSAVPSRVIVNHSLTLTVVLSGGTAPYRYVYSALPPGCSSANVSSLTCTPSSTGQFLVKVVLTDSAGQAANATTSVTVEPTAPSILSFSIAPSSVNVSSPFNLSVRVTGGALPLSFAYSGLPTGCLTQNASRFTCTSDTAGNYTIEVVVRDALGRSAYANASVKVSQIRSCASSGTGCPLTLGPNGSPETIYLVLVIVIAAVVIGVALAVRQRRKGRTSAPPPSPPQAFGGPPPGPQYPG